jgi:DNA repair ATPase RecN
MSEVEKKVKAARKVLGRTLDEDRVVTEALDALENRVKELEAAIANHIQDCDDLLNLLYLIMHQLLSMTNSVQKSLSIDTVMPPGTTGKLEIFEL